MSRDGSAVPRGQRTLVLMPADGTCDDAFCRVSRIFLGWNGCIAGQQFRSGMVGRYHHLETVERIQQMKREGRFQEALDLCYGAPDAAEQDGDGR